MLKRLRRLLKVATMRMLRSECFSRLTFSRTMWGLFLFLAIGVYFTIHNYWNEFVLSYFKWLGPFFFGARGLDMLTDIKITKKNS